MSDAQTQKTNWSLCAICQAKTKEPLQCPAESKRRSDVGAGYRTLANNVITFNELGFMPVEINLARLDEGDGIHETFLKRNARWHKSCYSYFNSTKLQRAELKRCSQDDESNVEPKYTRSNATATVGEKEAVCFLCDGLGSRSNPLHIVSSFGVDARVREYASSLQDEKLIAKLSEGDLIALDASYHTSCLASYYKKGRKSQDKEEDEADEIADRPVDSIVLAELVSYIEESRYATELSERIFKLSKLANMYTERMKQLGEETFSRVNTSRLKGRILSQIPSLDAYNEGRDVYLAFQEDVGDVLQKAHNSCDDEAIQLAKAATVVRKDMFSTKYSFDGSFNQNCQKDSVPKSMLSLIQMILYGPNIENQTSNSSHLQASLTISQLIQYNSYLRRRDGAAKRERRNKTRETPVPLYVGLSIHAKTRSRDLIETMHDLGLCVSYDRVLSISTDLGNTVVQRYQEEGVVCPPNLRFGLFTTAAVDNIDHNPSSTTAHDSFHGTGISMFQHMTPESQGTTRSDFTIIKTATNTKAVADLPESYTTVKPATFPSNAALPTKSLQEIQHGNTTTNALVEERSWLENTNNVIFTTEGIENVSWSAYHSNKEEAPTTDKSTISALLPLFPDDSKSVAMICHAMDVVKDGVSYLNPNQVPVIAMDQPLYAIAKQIQWTWKNSYGESKFVIMFGGLHIEMGFMKAIGEWLEDSGWTTALVDANVASSGTADSFLKASNVARTRKAHQITVCSLYTLLVRAYAKYRESLHSDDNTLQFDDWCDQQISASTQFYFWYTAMQLELLLLVFIRSMRQANFSLYIDSIAKMMPWFFAFSHTNYARWLSVHLHDMRALQTTAPDVAQQFTNGNFVVHKSSRRFSSIAIDQAHEQNNAIVKGDGGAVGLTENLRALRRWMVSGPELARLVNEFERVMKPEDDNQPSTKHHEEQKSFQASIARDIKELVSVFEDLGNPFMEDSGDLIVLDTKQIADSAAVARLRAIEATGVEQCNTFIDECLVKGTRTLYDPIKRNKRSFFCSPAPKTSKALQQVASLKSDCSLFSRLYISCQTRDGDLEDFFMHENQGCPPSLSYLGKLRLPNKKSELVDCLQSISPNSVHSQMPNGIQAVIVDGAVVVNMIKPGTETTFSGYATHLFLPYIKTQLRHAHRVDVVFDEYIDNSLKATTRSSRGAGARMRVGANIKLPRNWNAFLREDHNKRELFKFLAERSVLQEEIGSQIIATYGQQVLCTPSCDTSRLSPCTHEEADTRMMLHAADAIQQGHHKILVRTVDTDVLVLAVATFFKLPFQHQLEFWVAFGTGKHLRFIAVHELASSLGPDKSKALPVFHAFTGCDTVSCFAGRGKKTAMEAWKAYPDVTSAFLMLASPPCQITEEGMKVLERYVVLLYDRTSDKLQVNYARKQLFSQKGKPLDSIPPTKAALVEHTKRASFQAGHCWGQALLPQPQLPSPQHWGWTHTSDGWQPYWTSLPEVTKSCRELIRCGCKKGCSGRCSCIKADLSCTALCSCTCTV